MIGFDDLPNLPLKSREPFLVLERCRLSIDDLSLVAEMGSRRRSIPVGGVAALLLEPGVTVTHEAVKVCAKANTLLVWIGEGGVKLYSAGIRASVGGGHFKAQARAYFDDELRAVIARRMFAMRFGEEKPDASIEQLRGFEGLRVRAFYRMLAKKYRVQWHGRNYDVTDWGHGDGANRALSTANACLYACIEAAIQIAGYSPAMGFIHDGKLDSFVHDLADLYKPEITMPLAFQHAHVDDQNNVVRRACRDAFRRGELLDRAIKDAHRLFEDLP